MSICFDIKCKIEGFKDSLTIIKPIRRTILYQHSIN